VVMLVLGVGQGLVDGGGNTLLIWVYRDQAGPWMNGLHFCFGLGALLAPVVTAQVIGRLGDITWAYWLLAALMLPGALWLFYLPSPPRSRRAAETIPRRKKQMLVILLGLFAALYVGAEMGFGGWIFSYAMARHLSDAAGAAYLTAAFWGSLTAGRLLAVVLATRLRPSTMMLANLTGCVASAGLIMVDASSALLMWMGTCGLGFAMASVFPTILVFAERHMRITGQMTGALLIGASAGGMSVPWFIGQFFASRGPGVLPVTMLVVLVAALIIFVAAMGWAARITPSCHRT
jgi:MFS transporter, FHS family, Na+ dependent glucose transporter 1